MGWRRRGGSFWEKWSRRIERKSSRYITPDDDLVREMASRVDVTPTDTKSDRAYKAWELVRDEVDYEMSVSWKRPRETITKGVGDCQDMTFLLASMFPSLEIYESSINVGVLSFPDGRREEHTWNVVDNQIIDATGSTEDVERLDYRTEMMIDVIAEMEVKVE